MARLMIQIGPKRGPIEKTLVTLSLIGMVLVIPTFNEFVLSGGWAVDLHGGLIGLFVAASALKRFDETQKDFETADEAAEWVRKWEAK